MTPIYTTSHEQRHAALSMAAEYTVVSAGMPSIFRQAGLLAALVASGLSYTDDHVELLGWIAEHEAGRCRQIASDLISPSLLHRERCWSALLVSYRLVTA